MRINVGVIERILKAQKELDKAIFKGAGIDKKPFPINAISIAYNVELGELAQEWKGFKYWKKTKGEIDRSKLIEEYADCLHFAASLTNYYSTVSPGAQRFLEAFLLNVEELDNGNWDIECILLNCFGSYRYFDEGARILIDTLKLGIALGFTFEDIEEAYFEKNKINWDRLNNGY